MESSSEKPRVTDENRRLKKTAEVNIKDKQTILIGAYIEQKLSAANEEEGKVEGKRERGRRHRGDD